MFQDMKINDFTDKLSSESPVPGGGGAAALGAALAASLTAMVFNLTVGKKAFEEYDEQTKKYVLKNLQEIKDSKNEFLTFIDKDAEAFSKIIDSFKLPKNTDEEKMIRSRKIQEGYKFAAEVPMELGKKSNSIYEIIDVAIKYGNKNVISDAGAAAIFNHSVIEIAVLNIAINLSGIKDEGLKGILKKLSQDMLNYSQEKKDSILKNVYKQIY
ncbi:Formiminotetrahydrofolate cyclodeaminase [Clostridium acidisoli DSM 12555]|uniref:Formiminotetrahydrofolate cyclodeaminase n=2 Tax=Clostridium TaxID=1485 RepID=A0A1W1XB13_9CLOT|nr:Formiminotetrahydrofolate cyclodeaminase [Clostridium acidisoli DSM 12555]